jgi:hypothetical protein
MKKTHRKKNSRGEEKKIPQEIHHVGTDIKCLWSVTQTNITMFEILNAGQEPIIYNIISMGVTKI